MKCKELIRCLAYFTLQLAILSTKFIKYITKAKVAYYISFRIYNAASTTLILPRYFDHFSPVKSYYDN